MNRLKKHLIKYLGPLALFNLFFLAGLVACAQVDDNKSSAPPFPLPAELEKVYDAGQTLILYAYQDEVIKSEAYADWEAYLNDFKQGVGKQAFYSKVPAAQFKSAVAGATEFTLFLKKGFPAFLYDGLIVEPQVYSAVHRVFSKEPLRDIDRAFMPEEIPAP